MYRLKVSSKIHHMNDILNKTFSVNRLPVKTRIFAYYRMD